MKYKARRLFAALRHASIRAHFSQYGEDVHLHKHFRQQREGFYVDVGAHHPFHLSNTASLWLKGWRGINVDASQKAVAMFDRLRPQDTNICAAIVDADTAAGSETVTFYFSKDIDNCATCDPALARERGMQHSETVPCRSLMQILEQAHGLSGGRVDLLNIDIEGLDEMAVADVSRWPLYPSVLMIEIYGQTVRDVLQSPANIALEAEGYRLLERIGHTAIYHHMPQAGAERR
ncbi:MAG: FkbM family methyltransferase [Burkholderiaceae bacterium]|nr:FkbM family methyltransferase [Burkholderiaceae bacterium]